MNSTIKDIDIIELGEKGREVSSPWSSTILLVKLTSSDGKVGFGEAPTTLMTLPVKESMKEVQRVFSGADFFQVERNVKEFYRHSFYLSKSMEATSALSAFEIASWDLIGKELGSPVYNLIGGKFRDRMRAYANGWYSNCVTSDDFIKKAKELVRQGFTAMKFDPFGPNFDTITRDGLDNARNIVSGMREALGDKIDLLIECHGRFSTRSAIEAGKALEDLNPFFMEEPLHPEQEFGLAEFRKAVKVPVALGERLLNKVDFARFISSGLVDVIQPDITNSLGVLEGKKIAAIAESFGIPVAFHNAFGPIQTAATLNVDYTIPNFLIQESFEAFWPDWKKNLVRSGYMLENGYFTMSGKPGIGIDIDEKILSDYRIDGMEPFDSVEPPWVVSGTYRE
ncbi:MAG: mandelate racemase/muconate lactonizing enzyme family protein [Thermoplasmataceae archaeon]